jgi:hypothetical protein
LPGKCQRYTAQNEIGLSGSRYRETAPAQSSRQFCKMHMNGLALWLIRNRYQPSQGSSVKSRIAHAPQFARSPISIITESHFVRIHAESVVLLESEPKSRKILRYLCFRSGGEFTHLASLRHASTSRSSDLPKCKGNLICLDMKHWRSSECRKCRGCVFDLYLQAYLIPSIGAIAPIDRLGSLMGITRGMPIAF